MTCRHLLRVWWYKYQVQVVVVGDHDLVSSQHRHHMEDLVSGADSKRNDRDGFRYYQEQQER